MVSVPFPQINRDERDVLYRAIIADLPRIVDVVLAIGRSEYALARVLRTRYEAELLLLDDLGWTPTVPGLDRFELTSPPRRLAHALHRLGRVSHGRIVEYFAEDPATPLDAIAQARLSTTRSWPMSVTGCWRNSLGRRSLLPLNRVGA